MFQKIRDNREKFTKIRTVYVKNLKPSDYTGDEPLEYASNKVVTSKVKHFEFNLLRIVLNIQEIL